MVTSAHTIRDRNKKRMLHQASTIPLPRTLEDPCTGRSFPLSLRVALITDEQGGACIKAYVPFPQGYESELRTSAEDEDYTTDDNQPVMLYAHTRLIKCGGRWTVWLGSLSSLPCTLKKQTHPCEERAVKGLGRVALHHVIKAWLTEAPGIWPGLLPNPNTLEIRLMAQSEHLRIPAFQNWLNWALHRVGCKLGNHARLAAYYSRLGFRIKKKLSGSMSTLSTCYTALTNHRLLTSFL